MSTTPYTAIDKMFSGTVRTLASGQKTNVDARGVGFGVITASGTAKISRVDDDTTVNHGTGAGRVLTDQAATTFMFYSGIEWPFYVLEAVGGALSYFAAD